MKKRLLGYYDYTVVLTYCGMLFAFLGILESINSDYKKALLCLMMAGICDMFDGTVAATKDRTPSEKRFGIQIDSLSDLISFGALPAIYVYNISGRVYYVGLISGFYLLCALIRLAYFNVLEEDRQSMTNDRRETYLGVPVTTIALILPLTYLLLTVNGYENSAMYYFILLITAVGFVSPLKVKKPHGKGKIALILAGVAEVACMAFI